MGKMERDKGYRIERKTIKWLEDKGIHGTRRVPLSGGVPEWPNDLVLPENIMAEVKGRKSAKGWWGQPKDWLEQDDADVLFLWEDRGKAPIVVLTGDTFQRLFRRWLETIRGGKKSG